ncbi:acyl-CoA carboxylase subunit beta [Amycolatopsis rhabdoformis]|uniref:Acyl-CoA carboxylase subunit beta n=1 Tax=Amycolatopsis rhabdoformis TaxID=1448059 RepID=A0ABZ1IP67_9PSEU|nr:acyl-CoA carboxylase subunit beta [Amycolatopsis rhabdoformis]WSE35194.1 acyl-CoA carboxylase subunit beta [Amycolatopsis rhabdoformis]
MLDLQESARARTEAAAAGQHSRDKLTARERIDLLLDPGSFLEVGSFVRTRSTSLGQGRDRPLGDAVVVGQGTVHGREVCVFSQDFTVFGGSLGEVVGEKIARVMDMAMAAGVPMIGINDSAGGRIQEGVVAQSLYGGIFRRNVRMSGMVPQISLILGPCAGGAVYSPAITDFVVMVERTAQMFLTGPSVLREALGEQVSAEELGGALVHHTRSGSAHHIAATEEGAIAYVRELLTYLSAEEKQTRVPPRTRHDHALDNVIPGAEQPYDVRRVLDRVLDGGELLTVHEGFAPNILTGFGRLGGRSVGVVANQPAVASGQLDENAAIKAARFIRTCDAYDIPVLTFVDTPGFTATTAQEQQGAIRRFATLLYAYAEATVPTLTVITRRAAGIGYVAMSSRHLGADVCLAWPTAVIDGNPPYDAAERGLVDEVIDPATTRERLLRALRLFDGKKTTAPPRKHDNLPL